MSMSPARSMAHALHGTSLVRQMTRVTNNSLERTKARLRCGIYNSSNYTLNQYNH